MLNKYDDKTREKNVNGNTIRSNLMKVYTTLWSNIVDDNDNQPQKINYVQRKIDLCWTVIWLSSILSLLQRRIYAVFFSSFFHQFFSSMKWKASRVIIERNKKEFNQIWHSILSCLTMSLWHSHFLNYHQKNQRSLSQACYTHRWSNNRIGTDNFTLLFYFILP